MKNKTSILEELKDLRSQLKKDQKSKKNSSNNKVVDYLLKTLSSKEESNLATKKTR